MLRINGFPGPLFTAGKFSVKTRRFNTRSVASIAVVIIPVLSRLLPGHLLCAAFGKHAQNNAGNTCAYPPDELKWLALSGDNALVHDPVGPSPYEPASKGFAGKLRSVEFRDMIIALVELLLIPGKRIACSCLLPDHRPCGR